MATPKNATCAHEAKQRPDQVTAVPQSDRNPDEETGSSNEDGDEEDIGDLWDGAISIASNVIVNVFKSSRLQLELLSVTLGHLND